MITDNSNKFYGYDNDKELDYLKLLLIICYDNDKDLKGNYYGTVLRKLDLVM